jgi:hypothetical protein
MVGCATGGLLTVDASTGDPALVAQIVWLGFGTGLTVLVITSPTRTGENDQGVHGREGALAAPKSLCQQRK